MLFTVKAIQTIIFAKAPIVNGRRNIKTAWRQKYVFFMFEMFKIIYSMLKNEEKNCQL